MPKNRRHAKTAALAREREQRAAAADKAAADHRKALLKLGVPVAMLDRTQRQARRTKLRGVEPTKRPGLERTPDLPSTSNNLHVTGGHRRDLLTDHKWKRGAEENAGTVEAMQRKAKSLAPLYPKGPVQPATVGHKAMGGDGKRRP